MIIDPTGVKVLVTFGDSMSNPSRGGMRLPHFVTNNHDDNDAGVRHISTLSLAKHWRVGNLGLPIRLKNLKSVNCSKASTCACEWPSPLCIMNESNIGC